ncbi:hypothetical protein D3C72_1776670 [compost metagenome]
MGTGQVQDAINAFDGLLHIEWVGQIANQSGLALRQAFDGLAVEQAQIIALAQEGPYSGPDDTGSASDEKRRHNRFPKSNLVPAQGRLFTGVGVGQRHVPLHRTPARGRGSGQAAEITVPCFAGLPPTNSATISAPTIPRPPARAKPLP